MCIEWMRHFKYTNQPTNRHRDRGRIYLENPMVLQLSQAYHLSIWSECLQFRWNSSHSENFRWKTGGPSGFCPIASMSVSAYTPHTNLILYVMNWILHFQNENDYGRRFAFLTKSQNQLKWMNERTNEWMKSYRIWVSFCCLLMSVSSALLLCVCAKSLPLTFSLMLDHYLLNNQKKLAFDSDVLVIQFIANAIEAAAASVVIVVICLFVRFHSSSSFAAPSIFIFMMFFFPHFNFIFHSIIQKAYIFISQFASIHCGALPNQSHFITHFTNAITLIQLFV